MEWTKARVILPGLPEFYRFADYVDDIDAIFDFVDSAHQPRVPLASPEDMSIHLTQLTVNGFLNVPTCQNRLLSILLE
ncbi:MAG: hypothetical protein MUO58_14100 [Anaerolineales bacterium]|nr:hypothetical protein [Anaerolineales bacterium]